MRATWQVRMNIESSTYSARCQGLDPLVCLNRRYLRNFKDLDHFVRHNNVADSDEYYVLG